MTHDTPESTRLKLIKTLVLPHLDYCCFAYCNINKEQVKRLQGLLNAAIYHVPGWKNDRLKITNLRMQQVAFDVGLCLLKIHLRVKHNSGAGKMLTNM
jgi:hypothetical protein